MRAAFCTLVVLGGGETRKRVKSSRCWFCARQSVRNDLGPHGHGGPHRVAVLICWQCR